MSEPTPPRRFIPIQHLHKGDGKIHPRSISGHFQNWRWVFVWLTQILFYGLPWLPWNGRQAVLFDLETRRFYLFDLVLWPQDTIYLAILLVLSALALFLFTAVAGRLWCGYACPQTVYTSIFLWMEKLFEGERQQRIKLDAAPWSARKLRIKAGKQAAWLTFSLWTGLSFVGYFTPIRELTRELASLAMGPSELFWVLFYAGMTYGNAGFLREKMCTLICPYARFQSVMFDRDTLIITYDEERGDPRGSRPKKADPKSQGLGDCVDCGICVQVCPTGIDIRNGLQVECIGCAACIDACDQVMDKMSYPRGLIRYSTENALKEHLGKDEILRRARRPRTLIYTGIFLVITAATAWSLTHRPAVRVDVIRDRASMSREAEDGSIENVFRLQFINASERPRNYRVSVTGLDGIRLMGKPEIALPAAGTGDITLSVRAESSGPSGSRPILFTIQDRDDPLVKVEEKAKFWMQ